MQLRRFETDREAIDWAAINGDITSHLKVVVGSQTKTMFYVDHEIGWMVSESVPAFA